MLAASAREVDQEPPRRCNPRMCSTAPRTRGRHCAKAGYASMTSLRDQIDQAGAPILVFDWQDNW